MYISLFSLRYMHTAVSSKIRKSIVEKDAFLYINKKDHENRVNPNQFGSKKNPRIR
ncbi:hypothetical protein SAMN05216256_12021 [Halopseudomonas pachastrellae]|nr:hypothetical protein SAMN05216256_12021 [Halopseudomonas pachastrellae]